MLAIIINAKILATIMAIEFLRTPYINHKVRDIQMTTNVGTLIPSALPSIQTRFT